MGGRKPEKVMGSVYLGVQTGQQRNTKCKYNVFGVGHIYRATANNVRLKRKLEIQDGGHLNQKYLYLSL